MLHGFSQAHHQLSPLLAERLYPYWQSYRPSQALVITGSGAIEVVATLFVIGRRPRLSMVTLRLVTGMLTLT
jgi:hypothetical protein